MFVNIVEKQPVIQMLNVSICYDVMLYIDSICYVHHLLTDDVISV